MAQTYIQTRLCEIPYIFYSNQMLNMYKYITQLQKDLAILVFFYKTN